ncbi:hypothetical protein DXG01_004425 [Tephrocybe rancida]|nr:hypothetical protein DXG01_004425 [Tephrocybe rancida]
MSCPDCTAGEVLPGEPAGTISTLGAYFSPGSGENSKSAIVLLTDVFGLPLKNCKIIADHLAKETGYDVWIPDYFGGWPIFPLSMLKSANRRGGKVPFWKLIYFFIGLIPRIPALYHSRASVSDQRVVELVNAVKEEKKYEKIGAVGYCFGGSALARLGGTDLFQSVVIVHPGPYTYEQARAIKVPTLSLGYWPKVNEAAPSHLCFLTIFPLVIDDQFYDDKTRLETEAIFEERKGSENFVDYEIKVYKGTVHGFAIRPNLTNPEVKVAYEGSLEQIKAWFLKTLAI